jgi:hypothetical protein
MIQSQMTLSCRTLTKEQLAKKTWTCKDPLCRTPHHQTPTGYHFTSSTSMLQNMRSCRQESSEHGFTMTLTPHHYTGVSPCQPEVPDPSPHQHQTTPLACFIVRSPPKDNSKRSHDSQHVNRHLKSHQRLAEDAAHALLSGSSCHSHPYLLKYRSPVQNPPQEPWEGHPPKTITLATMPPHQEDTTSHHISQ